MISVWIIWKNVTLNKTRMDGVHKILNNSFAISILWSTKIDIINGICSVSCVPLAKHVVQLFSKWSIELCVSLCFDRYSAFTRIKQQQFASHSLTRKLYWHELETDAYWSKQQGPAETKEPEQRRNKKISLEIFSAKYQMKCSNKNIFLLYWHFALAMQCVCALNSYFYIWSVCAAIKTLCYFYKWAAREILYFYYCVWLLLVFAVMRWYRAR